MEFSYASTFSGKESFGCLVLLFPQDRVRAPAATTKEVRDNVRRLAALKDFTGKTGQTQLLPLSSKTIPRVLCVGLGEVDKLDREQLRRAAGTAAKALRGLELDKAGLVIPKTGAASLRQDFGEIIAEGMALGGYTFEPYKTQEDNGKKPRKSLARVALLDPDGITSAKSVRQGAVRGDAVNLARTLGNQPPNYMTPTQLAKEARQVARKRGLKLRVLEQAELEKLGMGMFMGVARGSRQPPKLILMEYRPRGAKGTLAFVGKGITFDSGGISLKPGQAMDEMKFDMCGAAAVVGAMDGIGALKPLVNVVGVIPACENLPDGNAVKPGDILKSYAGKHVEILNTDAEGRLVLGDALAYAIKTFKPDAVIDLATLTGACVIALGHYATGAISNEEKFLDQVVRAGKASGDVVWPLPNFPEYAEGLKGKYADLQNIGPREGGAITAGLFLKHFVGEVPWVHLDIAGTAWGVKGIGHIPYEGATGVGVGLLIDLAKSWRKGK
ncbi:MAG: leucyl aminopeptidase [SAR324 cluster bacterium]|nr:leucyl aminopeptidase [SAR324 cluster bacterium]